MQPELRDSRQEVEKHYGKYAGVVLAHANVPAVAAKRGEILVRVPGILEEDPSSGEDRPIEVIARPCLLPFSFFIPDENAQVWVEFVAGDINFAIWSAVWYPDNASPKNVDGGDPTRFQKVIHTTSGHVVQLDDSDGAERLVIKHKSGSMIEMDQNGKITITDSGNDTSIVSTKISLGTQGGASEPVVLGDTLKTKLDTLITNLMTHTHPTGVGPSGPPVEAPAFGQLKAQLQSILSTQNTTD